MFNIKVVIIFDFSKNDISSIILKFLVRFYFLNFNYIFRFNFRCYGWFYIVVILSCNK